jgi:predicted GNAT family N-acyltransferase
MGRLAVDQGLRGQGMGQFMLMNALHHSLQAAADIATMAVVMDAKMPWLQIFISTSASYH